MQARVDKQPIKPALTAGFFCSTGVELSVSGAGERESDPHIIDSAVGMSPRIDLSQETDLSFFRATTFAFYWLLLFRGRHLK